jgi:hypothetical protein
MDVEETQCLAPREIGCEVWVECKPAQKLSKIGGDHEKAGNYIFMGFGDHTDIVK